jgi:hypothetical protein
LSDITSNPTSRLRSVYDFAGNSYPITRRVETNSIDEQGRYTESKIIYNESHEFLTRYENNKSSRRVKEYGPIGDLMTDYTYDLDERGNDISMKNNITGLSESMKDYSVEDTLSVDGDHYEIHIYDYGAGEFSNACYINLSRLNGDEEIYTRYNCTTGSTLDQVRKSIIKNENVFQFRTESYTKNDSKGNWILSYTTNMFNDTSMYSKRTLLYEDDNINGPLQIGSKSS